MCKQICAPQMPHVCHTCKLVYMQRWGKDISISASYKITPITIWPGTLVYICFTLLAYALNTYAFYTAYVCPTSLQLYSTCWSHITAYTSKKTTVKLSFYTLLALMCQQQYALQMQHICYLLKLVLMPVWENYVITHASYELTTINSVIRNIGIDIFTLLAYPSQQIGLPCCTYMSHFTTTYRCNITAQISQKNNKPNHLPHY